MAVIISAIQPSYKVQCILARDKIVRKRGNIRMWVQEKDFLPESFRSLEDAKHYMWNYVEGKFSGPKHFKTRRLNRGSRLPEVRVQTGEPAMGYVVYTIIACQPKNVFIGKMS